MSATLGTPMRAFQRPMRQDSRRVWGLRIPERTLVPKITVALDGLGPGTGDQELRPALYDGLGNLIVRGTPFVVADGSDVAVYELSFPGLLMMEAGNYVVALHAGGADRAARLYGGARLANGARNGASNNPVMGVTGFGLWFSRTGGAATGIVNTRNVTDRALDDLEIGAQCMECSSWAWRTGRTSWPGRSCARRATCALRASRSRSSRARSRS
jgi:hypothetical protein